MKQRTTTSPNLSPSTTQEGDEHNFRLPLSPKELPACLSQIVANAPDNRQLPSFVASMAPLCSLATRVRLNYYYDSRPSALLLQVIIEGTQSCGKSFAANIEHLIMGPTLIIHDEKQRNIEKAYREKRKRRSQNKELEEEPKTTIRVIPATISKTVLTKRSDYYKLLLGDILTFWMFAEELAMVNDSSKQGYSNLRTIMRTAYDLGSQFGMDFASDNSYSAIVDINICSMFCATESAVDDYMDKKAIEGGNVTRQIICRLSDDIGADGSIFKPYTPEQMAVINDMLDKLMADTYDSDGNLRPHIYLNTKWLDQTVQKWCRAKGTEALLTGSIAIDVFRKRSSVSAFRCAALCYYMYLLEAGIDCRGEIPADHPTVKRAIRNSKKIYLFMADYILHGLLDRWGARFEELNTKREENNKKQDHSPTLLEELTVEFTRDQLKALLQQRQRTTPARVFICQWLKRKFIQDIGDNRYRKLIKQDKCNPEIF